MKTPRRYGAALRAYPARYRAGRGPELLATLADGDDDRGRPSTREAAALAYRGLAMRARLVTAPEGLLVAAAILVLVALTGGFVWAERVYLLHGQAAAFGTDGPGKWSTLALGVSAYLVLAPRRRAPAALLAFPLALAFTTQPGRLLYSGLPVVEFFKWLPSTTFHSWELALETMIATWVALAGLGRLTPQARSRVLGGALAILGVIVVAQTYSRPDLPPEYGQSAFADLGPAAFITAAGLLLASAALWRSRRQALLEHAARVRTHPRD